MRPNGPIRYGSQMYMDSPTGTPFAPVSFKVFNIVI